MAEEYSNRDEKLRNVVDGINYEHQRKFGVQRVISSEYSLFEQLDLPTLEGMGKYSPPKFKLVTRFGLSGLFTGNGITRYFLNPREINIKREFRKIDAKKNPRHNSTRERLMHREGRLAKFLN